MSPWHTIAVQQPAINKTQLTAEHRERENVRCGCCAIREGPSGYLKRLSNYKLGLQIESSSLIEPFSLSPFRRVRVAQSNWCLVSGQIDQSLWANRAWKRFAGIPRPTYTAAKKVVPTETKNAAIEWCFSDGMAREIEISTTVLLHSGKFHSPGRLCADCLDERRPSRLCPHRNEPNCQLLSSQAMETNKGRTR